VPQPGPTGPNFYDELRRAAEAEGRRLEAQQEQPANDGADFAGLREDNEQLVARRGAELSAERLAKQREEIFAESDEATSRLVEQAAELKQVRNRFETLGDNPVDLIEERYLDRHGGKPNPNDPYVKALREGEGGDPYESLRRAAIADDLAFTATYERYNERIEAAPNADARRSLEQQQQVFAEDHLAEVNHRIADFDEIITGSREAEDVLEGRDQAAAHETQAEKVAKDYQQRTGRDARADGLTDDALAREEAAPTLEQMERDAGVVESWDAAAAEVTGRTFEGPTPPSGRGGVSY
jgi:hypothetical protein